MKNKILLSIAVMFAFIFLSVSTVSADNGNGNDSVNWNNLNLNYKPPKVAQGEEEGQVAEVPATFADAFIHYEELKENHNIVTNFVLNFDATPQGTDIVLDNAKQHVTRLAGQAAEAHNQLGSVWDRDYISTGRMPARLSNQWKVEGSYFYSTGSIDHEFKTGFEFSEGSLDTSLFHDNTYLGLLENNWGQTDRLGDPTFDPDYNTPYLDELTLQFEKALTDDLAVSLTGFYKKKHDLAQDTGSRTNINPEFIQNGPPGIGGVPGVNNVTPGTEWELISPRIGLTYDITGDGKNVVKLSAARYMSQSGNDAAFGYTPIGGRYDQLRYDTPALGPSSAYSDYAQALSGTGPLLGGAQTPVTGGFNFGIDGGIGEMYGFGGPSISCGKVGKVCTIAIVDNAGRLVGTVNQDDLRTDPFKTHRLVIVAEESSRRNFSRGLHANDRAICAREPVVDRRSPSTSVTSDDIDSLPSSGRSFSDLANLTPKLNDGFNLADGHNIPAGRDPFTQLCGPGTFPSNPIAFNPGGVLSTQLGSSFGDLMRTADLLNSQLNCRSTGFSDSSCFGDFDPCSWAYALEDAYVRFPLRKKEPEATSLTPNDPYYWRDYGKKKSKVKERMKKITSIGLGGGLRIGGAGGGIGIGGKKKEPEARDQWGIRKVGYLPKSDPDSAWNVIDGTQKNTVVAVIDSGLDMKHEDAPEFMWTNPGEIPDNGIDDEGNGYVDDVHGWNFVMNNNDLRDYYGHGSFVTGIIAAKANNGVGIAGINPGAQIMVLKVVDKEGVSNSFSIYRAILYAVHHGAKVINISLGAKGVSKMEQLAINRAAMNGVLVVVAGGNVNENIGEHGPAAAARALAVGSIDVTGERSPISNWGPNNSLLAPGEAVWSIRSQDSYNPRTIQKQYQYYYPQNGTSFAAPMVAATASLLLAQNPALSPKQLEDILLGTASDLDKKRGKGANWDAEAGAGILNASLALRADPNDFANVKLIRLRVNRDKKKKLESVDVFATVRGQKLSEFTVGVGKGKFAKKFRKVAGPYYYSADHAWIARIDKRELRGSKDWIVEIKAVDTSGNTITARSPLNL